MTMKLHESCWRRMEQGTARRGGGGLALKSSGDRSSEVRGTGREGRGAEPRKGAVEPGSLNPAKTQGLGRPYRAR